MDERKFLSALLVNLENRPSGIFTTRWPLVVLWLVLASFFTIAFRLADGLEVNPVALAIGSLIVGFLSAYIVYSVNITRQWRLLSKHIDRESIRARLNELES